jgi:hypothetical protein
MKELVSDFEKVFSAFSGKQNNNGGGDAGLVKQ